MKNTTKSNKVLAGIGAAIALLIIVAVVLAIRPTEVFDPSTPQGAAQGYFNAVIEDDDEVAATYLVEGLYDSCAKDKWHYYESENVRITITDTEITNDEAELYVTIEFYYGSGAFGGGGWDQDEVLEMERQGDRWLISELVWPMNEYECDQ